MQLSYSISVFFGDNFAESNNIRSQPFMTCVNMFQFWFCFDLGSGVIDERTLNVNEIYIEKKTKCTQNTNIMTQ